MTTDNLMEDTLIETLENLKTLAENGKFREKKEVLLATANLSWFGNYGEDGMRKVTELRNDLLEDMSYDGWRDFVRCEL